uniref:Uncharacterized protein n=1 Tax=Fusarium oxysporum (strain Fo5176) TaxID=660025 RepID=A0A0D2Y2F9_FUSOF
MVPNCIVVLIWRLLGSLPSGLLYKRDHPENHRSLDSMKLAMSIECGQDISKVVVLRLKLLCSQGLARFSVSIYWPDDVFLHHEAMLPYKSDRNPSGVLQFLYKSLAGFAELSGEVHFENGTRSIFPAGLSKLVQLLHRNFVKVFCDPESLEENANTMNCEFDFNVRPEKNTFSVSSPSARVVKGSSHVQTKGLTHGRDSPCPNTIWKNAFLLVKYVAVSSKAMT